MNTVSRPLVAIFVALYVFSLCSFSIRAIDFDCIELPANVEEFPAACNGIDWCACLTSGLTHDVGGEAAGIEQAHIYPTDENTPGEYSLDVSDGTLHFDRLEVGDVIGQFLIDLPIGQPQNFLLDYHLIITELLPDAGANGIVRFEALLVNTNDTSIAVLTYDPLDIAHSEGILYKGELEAFAAERGFILNYHLTTEDEREPLADRSIQIGDLDSPGFNVPSLVSFFTPDFNDPPKDIYTLPVQGGQLVLETKITQIEPLDTTKEFEHLLDVKPGVLPEAFRRGDTDGSGLVDISDPIFNLTFQFVGGVELDCKDSADVDDSGIVDISDPIYNLTFQFVGGIDPPSAPGTMNCGSDPIEDELDCAEYKC